MKTYKLPAVSDVRRLRCNKGHSGANGLTFSLGYFECDGCGHFHTIDAVERAHAGPVKPLDGAGGVVRVK